MKKMYNKSIISLLAIAFCCYSCQNQEKAIGVGESLFITNCASCHNFQNDGIGPNLAGLSKLISNEEIKAFIKNPKGIIESGNERAEALFEKYKNYMPAYGHLEEKELNALISYIESYENSSGNLKINSKTGLENPIPDSITLSGIILNVEKIVRFPSTGKNPARTRLTKYEGQQGTSDLFMLDLNGILYKMENERPQKYFELKNELPDFISEPGLATGFGSFAFHPNFDKNGLLYTAHSEPAGTQVADFNYSDSIPVTLQWVLLEWKTEQPQSQNFNGKKRELFRIDMITAIHGMQNISFNPNSDKSAPDYGQLYIGIGDGGASEKGYDFLANGPNSPWSSIFRIDPLGRNSPNGKYGIPENNPFYESTDQMLRKEIFTYGFRNPHRFSWNKSNKMFSSNIGQHNIESIYILEAGKNYGWPYREGSFEIIPAGDMNVVYDLPPGDESLEITYSSLEYDHDEGNAVCGGFVYEGNIIPELKGKYVFGDIVNGRLFFADAREMKAGSLSKMEEFQIALGGKPISFMELINADRANLRIGKDHEGELYIFSKNEGTLYKLTSQ